MSTFLQMGLLAAAEQGAQGADRVIPASHWYMTLGVVGALLAGLLLVSYGTRTGIIARATTKEAVRQPLFLLLLAIALFILLLNTILPFFSFGEDVKMLKDTGLATILISGLLLAVWTSSTSIAAEIEGKTAMTLLSKPINRRQFVIGKYIGILQGVLWLVLPLMVVFLALVYYKVGYDAVESSKGEIEWGTWVTVSGLPFQLPAPSGPRWEQTLQIMPGLGLILLEAAVLTAVSVAISTRLPMVVNIVTCFAIFVIGHLTPVLVRTVFEGLEFVKFMAQLIATVLPSLDLFNTEAVVATDAIVPPVYLGMAALYAAAYCGAALLTGFLLFEDRDLA